MIALLVVTAAISGASIAAGRCDAVADFYRGRSISLVIGFGAGGGYDAYARLLARHIGRHIPGNPSLVAQNMQGAGGLKATQFLYDVAPRDGTVIGTALEWSGGRKNRTYTLPGAGEYEIKIRSQGLREVRLLVQASESGGVTPIYANLKGLAAGNADASDLRTIQVKRVASKLVLPSNNGARG